VEVLRVLVFGSRLEFVPYAAGAVTHQAAIQPTYCVGPNQRSSAETASLSDFDAIVIFHRGGQGLRIARMVSKDIQHRTIIVKPTWRLEEEKPYIQLGFTQTALHFARHTESQDPCLSTQLGAIIAELLAKPTRGIKMLPGL
jgi:hypothetical protein